MQRIFAILIAAIASIGIAYAQAPAKKAAEPAKEAAPMVRKVQPMDINTATEKDLATLPGIGEVHAKAIVKGRPYKGKDDLVSKKIVTQKVYDEIKDQIVAKQQM